MPGPTTLDHVTYFKNAAKNAKSIALSRDQPGAKIVKALCELAFFAAMCAAIGFVETPLAEPMSYVAVTGLVIGAVSFFVDDSLFKDTGPKVEMN